MQCALWKVIMQINYLRPDKTIYRSQILQAEASSAGKVPWMELDFFVSFCIKTKRKI
jgi:hypothetical protein